MDSIEHLASNPGLGALRKMLQLRSEPASHCFESEHVIPALAQAKRYTREIAIAVEFLHRGGPSPAPWSTFGTPPQSSDVRKSCKMWRQRPLWIQCAALVLRVGGGQLVWDSPRVGITSPGCLPGARLERGLQSGGIGDAS